MPFELIIRYLGHGDRCSNCGRSRETTRYTIRQGDDLLQQFKLCDACQDKGFAVQFNPRTPSAERSKDRRRRIKISRKLEKGVAEDLGGHTTPGSGNQDTKSDIRKVDEWRIEHKYTDSVKGYRVQVEDLSTVIKHANMAGEWPALLLNFRKLGRQFAIVPYEWFLEIVEKLRG
jgi:hypothetical protein